MVRKKKKKIGRPAGPKKSILNTTIRTEILNAFRDKCLSVGMPMGVILEMFMAGFVSGRFELTVGESNHDIISREKVVKLD